MFNRAPVIGAHLSVGKYSQPPTQRNTSWKEPQMDTLYTTSTNTPDAATYFAAQLMQFDKNYYTMVIEEHGVDRPLDDDICWFWQDFFFATLEEAEDFARDNNHKHIIEFTIDDLRAAYLRAFTSEKS